MDARTRVLIDRIVIELAHQVGIAADVSPAVRCASAVGAVRLTRRPDEGWRFVGAEVDALRKRAGIVVPEASGAGLAGRSGETGVV